MSNTFKDRPVPRREQDKEEILPKVQTHRINRTKVKDKIRHAKDWEDLDDLPTFEKM